MRKSNQLLTNIFILFTALALCCSFALTSVASEEEDQAAYLSKVRAEAQKAKAEAASAMAEAEKAIAEAESVLKVIEKRETGQVEDERYLVKEGFFPEDLDMHTEDGKVHAIFSHKKHTDREKLRCSECHPKVFIMKVGKNVAKKGHLTMDEMKKGKYCGNCHNGHKAFSVQDPQTCKKCHPKR